MTQGRLPGLLGKLGKMTSIRDTELLEQSLLRTLGPLLGVLDTSLYRTDEGQALARLTRYHCSKVVDADGGARAVERVEEVVPLTDIPAEVRKLTDNVRLLNRPCTRKLDGELLIAYPLLAKGEICGYFVFARDREVTATEDVMIRGVLEVFSNYYALLDLSQRDRLTGLLNRQALERSFDRIWHAMSHPEVYLGRKSSRPRRHNEQYWLAMIDVDHFKQVNDRYGHMVGDEILLLVARLMGATLRGGDLLYRYGGEEFVAIIAAGSEELAYNVFERVRLVIEAHLFPRVEQLTVSIGFCRATPEILPVEVLSRADRSLYQAKQDGRNRVYCYHRLTRDGVFAEQTYEDVELF